MIIFMIIIPIIIHNIDHHISCQILTIFVEAMASDLIVTHIKATRESSPPSLLGFYKRYLGVHNPNYKFMAEVVLTYCLALHVFRAGVRRNNLRATNAANTKYRCKLQSI